MSTNHLSEKINDLFAKEEWEKARALIEKEMAKRGGEGGHWLLTRLATTYYEERKYKKALKLEEEARSLAPDCPLVLWDYAGTLDALDRCEEAIDVYMSLILRGPEKVGKEECGEGLKWAVGLLTDCFYRVSQCLKHLRKPEESWKFFCWYAELVTAGADSMYSDTEAQKQIIKHVAELARAHPTRRPPRSPESGLKKFGKEAAMLLAA